MSKNSAKSKGYRKTSAKKPYLTKREIIILIVLVVLVAIGFAAFTLLTDDGALKVVDGRISVETENSVIVADSTSGSTRYFNIGRMTDVDGFSLTSHALESDANLAEFVYLPDGESVIDEVRVSAYSAKASLLSISTQLTYAAAEADCSELLETSDGVSYFTLTEEIKGAPVRTLSAYLPVGERCVVLRLFQYADEGEELLTDEALTEQLSGFLGAFIPAAE